MCYIMMTNDYVVVFEQLAAWIAEEKRKTEKWCESTKEAALRERRAAAKHVSIVCLL